LSLEYGARLGGRRREAAKACSPRRKPWVRRKPNNQAPEERKKKSVPALGPMDQDTNDGVAYLRSLKHSGTAAAPARALEPATRIPHGAEKRRAARYKCEGSAEIREQGQEVRTWATFSDISLHGCYIEVQATYPARTALYMKLEAHGIRFETNGVVRVSYPYLGMGVEFSDMTEENSSQLKRLLASLAQPNAIMGPGIASSLPATDPLRAPPAIIRPDDAISAMIDFFEDHQMLLRDDFVKILQKTQK
jgi:hypothetical protein